MTPSGEVALTVTSERGCRASSQAKNFVGLLAGEAERFPGLAGEELERQDSHQNEIGAVNALEAGGDHRADAEEEGAFGRPMRELPVPYSAPARMIVGTAPAAIFHGRVVNRNHFADVGIFGGAGFGRFGYGNISCRGQRAAAFARHAGSGKRYGGRGLRGDAGRGGRNCHWLGRAGSITLACALG